MSCYDEQCVEPSARLVDALANEMGRERALKSLLVLEGIVNLRVGHTDSSMSNGRAS